MGKVLYFLPGTMCNERLWQDVWPLLPADVVPVHLAIPFEHSLPAIIAALAERLPQAPVALVGFSLGGYIATQFAVSYPQRIERLLVLSNSPCALPADEISQRQQLLAWITQHGYRGISRAQIQRLLHPRHYDEQGIFERMQQMDAELGVDTLVQQLTATSAREDLFDQLQGLDAPLTFCHGADDNLVKPNWLAKLAAGRPNISHRIIRDAGHMLPLEQPRLLAQEITAWTRQ